LICNPDTLPDNPDTTSGLLACVNSSVFNCCCALVTSSFFLLIPKAVTTTSSNDESKAKETSILFDAPTVIFWSA
jgi:hypothetical protein